jgi:hypothetical protein
MSHDDGDDNRDGGSSASLLKVKANTPECQIVPFESSVSG